MNSLSAIMHSPIILPNPKVTISPVGLQITDDLNIEEWRDLATSIGYVSNSIAFIVGDWLVYGQKSFGPDSGPDRRVAPDVYQEALTATSLDLATLHNYAYVSRKVPYAMRNDRLSWEHHRILAKLRVSEQAEWICTCLAEMDAGRRMSTRRLRKSLSFGRVATPAELIPDESDRRIENHIPHVNRLARWWRHLQESRYLATSTKAQRETLCRDLEPIINIYNQLKLW
jgi:hypothetical protein